MNIQAYCSGLSRIILEGFIPSILGVCVINAVYLGRKWFNGNCSLPALLLSYALLGMGTFFGCGVLCIVLLMMIGGSPIGYSIPLLLLAVLPTTALIVLNYYALRTAGLHLFRLKKQNISDFQRELIGNIVLPSTAWALALLLFQVVLKVIR